MAREGAVYSKGRCGLCGERISRNGLAMASHLKKHVADGSIESKDGHTFGYCKVYKMTGAQDDLWAPSTAYF